MELCIDTSTRYAMVGVSRQGEAVAELAWRSNRNHSVELAPALRKIMAHAKVVMADVDAIFVAGGPGAFSALRVGMSAAKGMGKALGVPLVSVGTLDVEAFPYLGLGKEVCALIGAGRNRLYVGAYPVSGDNRQPTADVMQHEEFFAQDLREDVIYCGEGVQDVRDTLVERVSQRGLVANVRPPTRRAGVMASLGYLRLMNGEADDPATLQPMYLRGGSQIYTARQVSTKN